MNIVLMNGAPVETVRQTEKAIMIRSQEGQAWFPKSAIEVIHHEEWVGPITGENYSQDLHGIKKWFVGRMNREQKLAAGLLCR